MAKVKTSWARLFEQANLVLFNEYPNIINRLGEFELENFYHGEEDYEQEIFQWYIIGSNFEAEHIKEIAKDIADDIQYSETIGHYILAVRHFGTMWSGVYTEVEEEHDTEDGDKFFEKYYRVEED